MALDLILKDIKDSYARENFLRLSRYLKTQTILEGNWKFFEIELSAAGTHKFKHNLVFKPQDIIVLSSEGDKNFYFLHEEFDRTYIKVVANGPVRLRFLAGSYIEQGFVTSSQDLSTIAPPVPAECSASGVTWHTGSGAPASGLGANGDLYLDLDNGNIYHKAGGTWSLISSPSTAVTATKLQVTRIATEDILAGEEVKADSTTHVSLASGDSTYQEASVLGTAINAALAGASVDVVLMGVVDDAAYGIFTVNDVLFLDVDGGITNSKRSSGYHTIVGKSLGGTQIFVDVQPPTAIA